MLQIQALGLILRDLSNACQCQQVLLLVLHERRRTILEIWEALFCGRFLRLSVRRVRGDSLQTTSGAGDDRLDDRLGSADLGTSRPAALVKLTDVY